MYSKEDNIIIPSLQLGVDVICQKTWFHTLQYGGKNLFKTVSVNVYCYYFLLLMLVSVLISLF